MLLSFGFVACNAAETANETADGESNSSQTAQHSMPGMDHGSMNMSMDLGPKDETFDLRFIDAMIPHHEGAVNMAQEALQKSKRPEIQELAKTIIAAQDQEINQMRQWRKAWYPTMDDTPMMYDTGMGHMMPMSDEMRTSMMMAGDLGTADDQFDLRFIDAMIPHHQGAIDMANQAVEKSERPEIQKLAQDIISSQQSEIDQMQQWKQQWYSQ
ncbi:DUF305 domain-containing protein [Leptolyngbya sp. 7M]|nr:DUF305 domain-containing protein [Leptolyngbya sp. 7M]